MTSRYKQPDIHECSRDYLIALAENLEEQKADVKPINEAFLAQVKAAIPYAPLHFITHEL